MLMTCV
jgi:Ran-binding protein 1